MENIVKGCNENRLQKYKESKEYVETLLLDLLRAHEMEEDEYNQMKEEMDIAYKQFLKDFK